MNDNSVLRAIESVQRITNTTPQLQQINRGGCGVFAYALGRQLAQLVNKKVISGSRIRVGSRWDYTAGADISAIANDLAPTASVDDWHDYGINFHHIVTEVDVPEDSTTVLVDAENTMHTYLPWAESNNRSIVEPSCESTLFLGDLPLDHLYSLVRQAKGWNSSFNRNAIPLLFSAINKYISRPFGIDPVSPSGWELKPRRKRPVV